MDLSNTDETDRSTSSPHVSLIIPAFNASSTLAATLESVQRQSFTDWEAIVIDDGSTDDTAQLAEAFSEHDPRIRVLRQPNQGVAATRNTGIAQAAGTWLLFLDSDDIILPEHLSDLVAALAASPEAGASFAGWWYETPDGRRMPSTHRPTSGDLFTGFARSALFAIHACLVRRDLVERAGGFDTSMKTCEDWDLWQRVARLGTYFARTRGDTAIYRMRPQSLSRDAEQMLVDGLRVIEMGFSRDPRVIDPAPRHARGEARGDPRENQICMVCWVAAEVLGLAKDARDMLRHVPPSSNVSIDPKYVAECIFEAAVIVRCLAPSDWIWLWDETGPHVIEFLEALEQRIEMPALTTRSLRILERLIVQAARIPAPLTIGGTHAVAVEVTAPIEDIDVPAGVDRLHLAIALEGDRIGDVVLPVYSPRVSADLIADAIAAKCAWRILDRFFATTIYPHLVIRGDERVTRVYRDSSLLLETPADPAIDLRGTIHDHLGWTIFLQEIWDQPAWNEERFYDVDTIEATTAPAVELAGRDWIGVELSRDPPDIVTERPARIVLSVAGIAIGALDVVPAGSMIGAQRLRAAITGAGGLELCRACVREGLLGRPLSGPPLRQRLRALADSRPTVRQINEDARTPLVAGHIRTAPDPALAGVPACFVRRQAAPSLTSVSRLMPIPSRAASELRHLTRDRSEIVLGCDDGGDVWYAPDIIPLVHGRTRASGTRARALDEPSHPGNDAGIIQPNETPAPYQQPALRPRSAVATMRRLARRLSSTSSRSTATTKKQPRTEDADPDALVIDDGRLPVLMYHRVSATGATDTARYRVTPRGLEEQLAYLRDAGYRSVHLDELQQALESRKPLPGKRVMLTFDDAYVDFAETAWPILRRYGFDATLFVVSGYTGGTNEWDRRLGEELELLDWDALRDLRAAGVTIGAHTDTHPHLTSLPSREIACQAARSRRGIEQQLGAPVRAFAYPYGDRDELVERIVGSCGFTLGFTCVSKRLHVHDAPLSLPRIEVEGSDDLATFARKLTY